MRKTVFLFAGQGSQYPGMGKELLEVVPSADKIYECASDILGFDLKKTCFESSEQELAVTKVSQPAIFATSLVALEAVKSIGIEADGVAGHSLGEYGGLVAAGALDIETAFKVIKARSQAMQNCAENNKGSMCAILGCEEPLIEEICEKVEGYVVPVNYNCTGQTVIAGEEAAVDKAMQEFANLGKKAIKLAVSAAFHSKLMEPAANEFKNEIQNIKFNKPTTDFYSNLTGEKLEDFSDMSGYLSKHIISPVLFTKELNSLYNDGYTTYIELGPNKTLTSFVKKTIKGVNAYNVENIKTFEKLKEEIANG